MNDGAELFSIKDRWRLALLLASDETRALAPRAVRHELQMRLEEADVASPDAIADDVVTMNSTVRLLDTSDQTWITRTVTYPDDVDLMPDGVSVLEPMGSLLLGRKVGDVFHCECGPDTGRWQVAEITYQPERAGAFHR